MPVFPLPGQRSPSVCTSGLCTPREGGLSPLHSEVSSSHSLVTAREGAITPEPFITVKAVAGGRPVSPPPPFYPATNEATRLNASVLQQQQESLSKQEEDSLPQSPQSPSRVRKTWTEPPAGHFPLVCLDKKEEQAKVVVGKTRVQNYWGDSGTVVWMGTLGKEAAWGKGVYCGVQYDNPNPLDEKRSDGVHAGERLCTTPPHTCDFNPLRHLYFEVNHLAIDFLRHRFGERVDFMHDYELVKIAVARNFDSDAMVKTLERHLDWLESDDCPDITREWYHPTVHYHFPAGFPEAWDREGNLLHVSRPGRGGEITPSAVVKELGAAPLVRQYTAQYESMKAILRQKGFVCHRRFSSLYDMTNCGSVDGRAMEFAKGVAAVVKDHQLEMVNKIYMVNAPFVFRMFFKAISVFMDERTKDKVIVMGSNYVEELPKYIDPKFLPSFAGGTNDEWFEKKGRVAAPPPEDDPPVTFGVLGKPYDEENNLFPAEKEKREKQRGKR